MKSKRVPVVIDAELYTRLKAYSDATDLPVARVVARGLTAGRPILSRSWFLRKGGMR